MYIFFDEVFFGLLPIFELGCVCFLLWGFKSSLYILDNSPLPVVSFASISLSLWPVISFSWQCHLQNRSSHLVKSSLLNFFVNCAFGVVPKMSSPYPRTSTFSPVIFWELYTFEFCMLIFMKGVRLCPDLFFYMWMSSYSSTICGKDSLFSIALSLLLCE